MNSRRIIKLIATICFALLTLAIIVAIQHPARGYEMSIYKATPAVVWITIILSIICGAGIIAHQVYHHRVDVSKLWVIGLLLLSFSFIILLSVHVFRGYLYVGRADATSHLSVVRGLLNDGHISRQNFYPVTHVYIAQLSQVWNLPLARLFSILPALFNTFFILFIYLFARTFLSNKGQVVLATIVGVLLLSSVSSGSVYTDPNQLADLIIPLAFMLCFRRLGSSEPIQVQITVLFLIMIFLIPPWHIVPAFVLLLVLTSLWMPVKAYNAVFRNHRRAIGEYRFIIPAAVIIFVWSISWASSFYVWESTVKNVYLALTRGGPTWASQLEDQMLMASQYGYSVLEKFFKTYYGLMVYAVLSLLSLPIILSKVSKNRNAVKLLPLYGPLFTLAIVLFVFYTLNVGFSPARFTKYEAILSVPLVGFVIYELVKYAPGKKFWLKVAIPITALAFILMAVNGVFIAYFSPYNLLPGDQPTLAEPDGFDWLNAHRDSGIGLVTLTLPLDRMAALLPNTAWAPQDVSRVPYHFNYPEHESLGEFYTTDKYLALTTMDKVLYVDLFPEMAPYRFYQKDFDELENDSSVERIFFNQGMEIWYVRGLM